MRFSWAIRIGAIAGITIRLHVIFILVLLYLPTLLGGRLTLNSWTKGLVFYAALFLFVLLHELSHSLVAKRYGIRVLDITLLPIGGVARMESFPQTPRQELLIAIAGPALNLAVAAIIGVAALLAGTTKQLALIQMMPGQFIPGLFWVNLFMAGFNLRAGLAFRMPYVGATRIAARIGQGCAVVLGVLGLLQIGGGPFLVIIAVFIFFAAGNEANAVITRAMLQGVYASQIMARQFTVLNPADPIGHAIEQLYSAHQDDFPVIQDGRLIGLVTREAIARAYATGGGDLPVSQAMQTSYVWVSPDEELPAVYEKMNAKGATTAVVIWSGQLIGLISRSNISRHFALASELDRV
jgi:Zn-dependent protease/predicted transcriptional regulator